MSDRCCDLRVKVMLTPYSVPEELCGVPDVALADAMIFDKKSDNGRNVLCFRFCPWCGKPWAFAPGPTFWEQPKPEVEEGDEWKQDAS